MFLLDLTIPDNLVIAIAIAVIFLIWLIVNGINSRRSKLKSRINELELVVQRDDAKIELLAEQNALARLETWKEKELKIQVEAITKNAFDAARNVLEKWKMDEGKAIREDAVKRSMAVNLGKITEHLIPFSAQFKERGFNPQDARFIGSPIDLMLFHGAATEKAEITIFFVEVKTGKSALNEVQRRVREAVKNLRVEWVELTKGEFSWESAG
jgi:predicted Holliday junction resolvase-like endonuclease